MRQVVLTTALRVAFGVLAAASALGPAAAGAVEPPAAVSPGSTAQVVLVQDRCPAFSWGEVDGAERYELVAYRLGNEADETELPTRDTEPVDSLRSRPHASWSSWS